MRYPEAIALIGKRTWLLKFTLGAVLVWFVFYAVMLIGFSLISQEKELALNQPKAYCGFYLDCHMHTMVTGVRTTNTIGDQSANGIFYVANVKVFSDARNPNIKLRLITPDAVVVDANGTKVLAQ